MKPRVNNKCQKHYRINVEKVVQGIIYKVPEKYLEGLDEVYLLDYGEPLYPICRYVSENEGGDRRIEIYLENHILSKVPLFSTLALNIYLLLAINQHIDRYLKNKTEDQEILSIDPNRVNYAWMYFSTWNPLFLIIKILNYSIAQTQLFQRIFKRWADNLFRKINKK
jgi:hypothetical protein